MLNKSIPMPSTAPVVGTVVTCETAQCLCAGLGAKGKGTRPLLPQLRSTRRISKNYVERLDVGILRLSDLFYVLGLEDELVELPCQGS